MIIFEIGKSAGETGFNKISFVGFAIIFGVFSGSKSNDDGGNDIAGKRKDKNGEEK